MNDKETKTTEEIKNKIKDWDESYRVYEPTILGVWAYKSHRNVLNGVLDELNFNKDISLLDVGCGKCSTTIFFKEKGFVNIIGIDLADSGLKMCECQGLKIGRDVFKIDATDTPYDDQSFDLVFGEGILEHYKDFMPFVREMCRIANDYIIIIQPNHYSIYGRIMKIGWLLLQRKSGGVQELTYKLSQFHEAFGSLGFYLDRVKFTPLRENAVIVYRRRK